MCVALIGGMDRLTRHYINEARQFGIDLKVFTNHKTGRRKAGILSKIKKVDAVLIFTNKVSHNAKNEVVEFAKNRDIPVHMYHSCGVCTLRDCFHCLNEGRIKDVSTCSK